MSVLEIVLIGWSFVRHDDYTGSVEKNDDL